MEPHMKWIFKILFRINNVDYGRGRVILFLQNQKSISLHFQSLKLPTT